MIKDFWKNVTITVPKTPDQKTYHQLNSIFGLPFCLCILGLLPATQNVSKIQSIIIQIALSYHSPNPNKQYPPPPPPLKSILILLMNRLTQTFSTTLDHLLETYHSGNHQQVTAFIEKRYTRFQQFQSRITYSEAYEANKQRQELSAPVTKQQFLDHLEKYGVNEFYSSVLVDILCALPQHKKNILMNYEMEQSRRRTSHFHGINKVSAARKNCLRNLKYVLEQSMKESIARLSELDKLCMILIHMRMLTLALVEAVYEWNYSVGSISEQGWKEIRYQHDKVEVYTEVCEDIDFLRDTVLKRYLKFAKGFDPLLIRISRRRKQSTIGKVEDLDRFADFFQPDFNILSRLRQAETLLIKYHSSKVSKIKDIGFLKDQQPVVQKQQQKESFADIVTVETKNIHTEAVIDLQSVKISLPKLVGPMKIKKENPNRIVGTIFRNNREQSPSGNIKKPQEVKSPKLPNQANPPLTSLKPSANILHKLKFLKDHYIDNNIMTTHKRQSSSANLLTSNRQIMQSNPFISGIFPTLSETKIYAVTPQYKRKRNKEEKLRFLKQIYRDKTRADTEIEASLAKYKASEKGKRKRKHKRVESLNLNLKYNGNLNGEADLEKNRDKYYKQF